MKKLVLLFLIVPAMAIAQKSSPADSLKLLLSKTKTDTQRVNILNTIADRLKIRDAGEATKSANEAIALSKKINFKKGLAMAYYNRGKVYLNTAKSDSAIGDFLSAISLYRQLNNLSGLAWVYNDIGLVLRIQGKQSEAISYFQQASDIFEKLNDLDGTADCLTLLANNFGQIGEFDKALTVYKKPMPYA